MSEIIQPHHLNRKALIYIRQSTPQQVLTNQESQRLQYALKQRAEEFGWSPNRIEMIDSDLGRSGTTTDGRKGFESLVAQVTLGEVGIILCYDVSRLSRNCTDWFPLLDVCSYRQCLIADRDGIYDPGNVNGRMLLGLKGQMSELEMHTIRGRLRAGQISKAKRGELPLKLPIGYVRDQLGRVDKDPDLEVQKRIELIFETFLRLKTVNKTTKYFLDQRLDIPRRNQWDEIVWRKPTHDAVLMTLRNPCYAGLYVYGRTTAKTKGIVGYATTPSQRYRVKPTEWQVVLENSHPAYVSRETYDHIQQTINNNHSEYHYRATKGVPRQGDALLHGLIFCGKCGHKMSVRYRDDDTPPYYRCMYFKKIYKTPACQIMSSEQIDEHVTKAFFAALSPAEINLYSQILEEKQSEDDEANRALKQSLERLRYQARLAERQFNKVDPDNRLVASELERRWENALKDLQDAEDGFEQRKQAQTAPRLITKKLRESVENVGKMLPEVWNEAAVSREHQKALLRSLIDKVVLDRTAPDSCHIRIVWKGGATSECAIALRTGSLKAMANAEELEQAILDLASEGFGDEQIAKKLTARGFRSPRASKLLPSTVQIVRLRKQAKRRITVTNDEWRDLLDRVAKGLGADGTWLQETLDRGSLQVGSEILKAIGITDEERHLLDVMRSAKRSNVVDLKAKGKQRIEMARRS